MNKYKIVKINLDAGNMEYELPTDYQFQGVLYTCNEYIVVLCTKYEHVAQDVAAIGRDRDEYAPTYGVTGGGGGTVEAVNPSNIAWTTSAGIVPRRGF